MESSSTYITIRKGLKHYSIMKWCGGLTERQNKGYHEENTNRDKYEKQMRWNNKQNSNLRTGRYGEHTKTTIMLFFAFEEVYKSSSR